MKKTRNTRTAFYATLGLLAFASVSQAQNLILNGDFESGDFSDWIVTTPPAGNDAVISSAGPLAPYSGNYFAAFGTAYSQGVYGQYTISQTFSIASDAGGAYQFDFALNVGGDDDSPVSLTLDTDGLGEGSIFSHDYLAATSGWEYHDDFTTNLAGGSSVTFTFTTSPGENAGDVFLDDISFDHVQGSSVPDAESDFWLLSSALFGVGAARRAWSRRKTA